MKRNVFALLSLVLALVAGGLYLASPGLLNHLWLSSEELLKSRVEGLMDTIITRNWEKAADYVRNSGNVVKLASDVHFIRDFEIQELLVDGDEAQVRVRIEYNFFLPNLPQVVDYPLEMAVTQKWKKGWLNWYYEPARKPRFAELFRTLQAAPVASQGDVGPLPEVGPEAESVNVTENDSTREELLPDGNNGTGVN